MNTTNDATNNDKQQVSMSKVHDVTAPTSGKLLLVRHAESEWNLLGKWTGRTDVHLTDNGRDQAAKVGEILKDIELHHAYTSEQIRTVETLANVLEGAGKQMEHERSGHLNERDYGEYTGLNKWEVLEQLGEDTFTRIRRSWDEPIPGGETLEMVHERAVPFYNDHILPKLLAGQNVIVVSHGNTIRALIKYLEDISHEGIAEVEMPFGQVLLYHVTPEGKHHSKETRKIDIKPPHA
ncbi:MAG TPA: 2,3-bisphosphoglycerate-dependent phosphoglycerate mutase [Candidatus Saccharimonadales bacterium]|nr:2,3-bisphosphoglycerate-dependent phosphoglycerate mutase [Candidatus Saccharimonadales bacterium]